MIRNNHETMEELFWFPFVWSLSEFSGGEQDVRTTQTRRSGLFFLLFLAACKLTSWRLQTFTMPHFCWLLMIIYAVAKPWPPPAPTLNWWCPMLITTSSVVLIAGFLVIYWPIFPFRLLLLLLLHLTCWPLITNDPYSYAEWTKAGVQNYGQILLFR